MTQQQTQRESEGRRKLCSVSTQEILISTEVQEPLPMEGLIHGPHQLLSSLATHVNRWKSLKSTNAQPSSQSKYNKIGYFFKAPVI